MSSAADPNQLAVERARLDASTSEWLRQVADVVDARLDAVRRDWRALPDRDALRAAAYGLLLAVLAARYPATRGALAKVAEAHPSYGTLPEGRRLPTLERIAGSPRLVTRWVGPLLEIDDDERLAPLRT